MKQKATRVRNHCEVAPDVKATTGKA
jgi:electron transport complex protein RnfE